MRKYLLPSKCATSLRMFITLSRFLNNGAYVRSFGYGAIFSIPSRLFSKPGTECNLFGFSNSGLKRWKTFITLLVYYVIEKLNGFLLPYTTYWRHITSFYFDGAQTLDTVDTFIAKKCPNIGKNFFICTHLLRCIDQAYSWLSYKNHSVTLLENLLPNKDLYGEILTWNYKLLSSMAHVMDV